MANHISLVMVSYTRLFYLLSFLALASWAVPIANDKLAMNEKRSPQNVYPQGASDAVVLDIPTATAVPPSSASGGLYGDEGLLGYDGNPVTGSAIVEDYELVPGQSADAIEGIEVWIECQVRFSFQDLHLPCKLRYMSSKDYHSICNGVSLSWYYGAGRSANFKSYMDSWTSAKWRDHSQSEARAAGAEPLIQVLVRYFSLHSSPSRPRQLFVDII